MGALALAIQVISSCAPSDNVRPAVAGAAASSSQPAAAVVEESNGQQHHDHHNGGGGDDDDAHKSHGRHKHSGKAIEVEPFAATSSHPFDNVEHWQKVFDDPKRVAWQKPEQVVEALELPPGARVADLGAGTGFFTAYLARAVGPTGTVYALETEPNLVDHLRERAETEALDSVIPVLCSFDNPRLPAASVDLVMITNTFHHIDARDAYFGHLSSRLRAGGRIAVIDWRKKALPVGPAPDHKLERERVIGEMQSIGYDLAAEHQFLDYQYFLIFAPRP